jgi:hypothetical protein
MSALAMVSFSSPQIGIAAVALAIVAVGIAVVRRISMPILPAILMVAGMISLALAAGDPVWNRSKPGTIAVMVDLSPSTRGARFRSGDYLRGRVRELIGDSPREFIAFADHNMPVVPSGPMEEMPADETRFSAAAADAIVLFSDARFDLPKASPPVYVAADENLENVTDASVQALELRGQTLGATVANSGPAREASFEGVTGSTSFTIDPGKLVITQPIGGGTTTATVKLNAGDLWPENDSLSLRVTADPASEKWWVGENSPGGNWRMFTPQTLSDLSQEYLAPAIIVVNNESADGFTPTQMDCLMRYVRDLGGSLLILGGDHAFAAGGYSGSALEELSPLSSSPPDSMRRWVLLVDGSGSMNGDAGGGISRWQSAAQAVVRLLPALPPADLVQIGQFSDVMRWWSAGTTAAKAAQTSLPPTDAYPHGPTNLESALNRIARDANGTLPTELLLVSDCDTTFDHPGELGELLAREKIRLHVLAIGRGSALGIIRRISVATGGEVVEQLDPHKWAQSAAQLSRAALPSRVMHEPVTVVFENEAKSLASENSAVWNRTWLKPQAARWASAMRDSIDVPMAGYWRVGSGCVAAVAYEPSGARIEAIAERIAEKPRDPRFSVQWETGQRMRLIVDAVDSGKFINGLSIQFELLDDAGAAKVQVEQTGPGRYEASFGAARNSRIATLRVGNEVIGRASLPGRYPAEFDAVGNDHAAMRELAERSGGAVIWPTDHGPIDFRWPRRETSLTSWICAAALVLIGAGLALWRWA